MKTKLAILIALTAFIFASCSEKDYYDESLIEKKVGDLDVPVNFDWNMTRTVACNFTTTSISLVKVYTENRISDDCLVAEYVLTPEPDQEALGLPVPTHLQKLYIEINESGRLEEVKIEKGQATFELPATRSNKDYEYGFCENAIYYPAKCTTMATVMFEDFFPIEGDYDFNDFVANYRFTVWLTPILYQVRKVDINVIVKALGGTFEYTPYIRLKGAPKYFCTSAEVEEDINGNIILPIKGYTQKPEGAQYLNTIPTEVKVTNLKEVEMSLNFNIFDFKWITYKDLEFDFFLKGKGYDGGSYEIHERGKNPVDPALYPSDNSNLGNVKYTTNKNLVWGFTVPKEIKHAVEGANFLTAYPEFKGWVESAGENNKEWYLKGNNTHLFNLN